MSNQTYLINSKFWKNTQPCSSQRIVGNISSAKIYLTSNFRMADDLMQEFHERNNGHFVRIFLFYSKIVALQVIVEPFCLKWWKMSKISLHFAYLQWGKHDQIFYSRSLLESAFVPLTFYGVKFWIYKNIWKYRKCLKSFWCIFHTIWPLFVTFSYDRRKKIGGGSEKILCFSYFVLL